MVWLRLVGSLKLGSSAKEPYKRDCDLQKRLIILSSLLTVATPHHIWRSSVSHVTESCNVTLNKLRLTEQVVSHIWQNNLCHTYGSHISHSTTWVTPNNLCLTYGSHMAHICLTVSHISHSTTCVTHMAHTCLNVSHISHSTSFVSHMAHIRLTCVTLSRTCHAQQLVCVTPNKLWLTYDRSTSPICRSSVWRMTDALCLACDFCKRAL